MTAARDTRYYAAVYVGGRRVWSSAAPHTTRDAALEAARRQSRGYSGIRRADGTVWKVRARAIKRTPTSTAGRRR